MIWPTPRILGVEVHTLRVAKVERQWAKVEKLSFVLQQMPLVCCSPEFHRYPALAPTGWASWNFQWIWPVSSQKGFFLLKVPRSCFELLRFSLLRLCILASLQSTACFSSLALVLLCSQPACRWLNLPAQLTCWSPLLPVRSLAWVPTVLIPLVAIWCFCGAI